MPQSANDTIVAISTPPGRGGIGIVRLSGPEAVAIATPMLRLKKPLAHAEARFGEVLDNPPGTDCSVARVPIDEAIVTLFAAPNSYTGEDIVEIAAHGSPVVLNLLLRQAIERGARLAEPGEFSQRAFLCGRLDLTQAEAVRDLIDAQTLYQARVAASQLEGALSRRIRPAKEALIALIASLEAGIDFAEDDIDVLPTSAILEQIAEIQRQLAPIEASFTHGRIIHDGLTLAIVGQPNVGKSSLFNRLVERERAIVTETPGTTRDPVTERVSIGGIPITLVDTAGLREAADEAEVLGIQKSYEALAEADIVILVLDATAKLSDRGPELLEQKHSWCNVTGIREVGFFLRKKPVRSSSLPDSDCASALDRLSKREHITVLNKIDLVDLSERETSAAGVAAAVSAKTGEGILKLREILLQLIRGSSAEEQSGMLTNLRQHQAVAAASGALEAAARSTTGQIPHEMIMLDLYSALRHLDELTGQTTSDDILHLIFSTFCIGK